jgi:hypothetical protein
VARTRPYCWIIQTLATIIPIIVDSSNLGIISCNFIVDFCKIPKKIENKVINGYELRGMKWIDLYKQLWLLKGGNKILIG